MSTIGREGREMSGTDAARGLQDWAQVARQQAERAETAERELAECQEQAMRKRVALEEVIGKWRNLAKDQAERADNNERQLAAERADVSINARWLARQCDLAREAEARAEHWKALAEKQEVEYGEQHGRLERLEAALRWYGEESRYTSLAMIGLAEAQIDGGELARKALEG